MKKNLFFMMCAATFFLAALQKSTAQSILDYDLNMKFAPPMPGAVVAGSDYDVSYFTGTVSVGIPITALSGRQLSVPVSLSYRATGLKRYDQTSNVGLGWTLNAGGVIVRSMAKLPDEDPQGLYTRLKNGETAWGNSATYYADLNSGAKDAEPDKFYYNLLGNSGQLQYNNSGVFYDVDDRNMKVLDHPLDATVSTDERWELVDSYGNRYIFGSATSTMGVGSTTMTGAFNARNPGLVTVKNIWLLTQIISADGSDIIDFTYTDASISYDLTVDFDIDTDCNTPDNFGLGDQVDINPTTSGKIRLTKIEHSKGSVEFSYSGNQVYTIIRKDRDAATMSTHQFTYGTYGGRKYLINITEKGSTGLARDPYIFDYYAKSSTVNYTDHWGFATTLSNENANQYSIMGTLDEIEYPSGKKTEFSYENHSYNSGSTSYTVGGIRIKSIKEYDTNNPDSVKVSKFEYKDDSGNPSGKLQIPGANSTTGDMLYVWADPYDPSYDCYMNVRLKGGTSLLDGSGSPVVYPEVRVLYGEEGTTYGDFGMTQYTYSYNDSGLPDGLLKETTTYRDSNPVYGSVLMKPVSSTINTWYRQVRETVSGFNVYKSQHNRLGNELGYYTANSYTIDVAIAKYITRTTKRSYDFSDETRYRDVVTDYTYAVDDEYQQLSSTAYTDQSGIVYETVYTYPKDYTISAGTTVEAEKALKVMQEKHIIAPVIEQKQLIASKVASAAKTDYYWYNQSETDINDKRVYAQKVFSTELDAPIDESTFNSGNYYVEREAFVTNDKGQVIESSATNDIVTSVVLGYDNTLPVASAINAESDQVYYNSFEESGGITYSDAKTGSKVKSGGSYTIPFSPPSGPSYKMSYWYYTGGAWQFSGIVSFSSGISKSASYLDEIRVFPEGARMTTTTYNGRGLATSVCDANNNTLHYEYDSFGRVSKVLDQNNYVIEQYDYQIAGR
ncbi:MAG: RHS repeat protein [Cytophagales bacterium]|nr:RHS repeat protein [Cytophagales bacterium]